MVYTPQRNNINNFEFYMKRKSWILFDNNYLNLWKQRGGSENQHTMGKYTKVQQSRSSSVAEGGFKEDAEDEEDESGDEHGDTLCGSCGEYYASDEFWICCDLCEIWFHGKCVKMTQAKADQIDHYKCPLCVSKRSRVH